MKIIYLDENYDKLIDNELSIAIGNFDGIHIGHIELINKVCNLSNPAVFTFSPHPFQIINNLDEFRLLTPTDYKIDLLKKYNLKYLIIFRFTRLSINITKENFIAFLKKIGVTNIVCGNDFRFGKNKLGNIDDLKQSFNIHIPNTITFKGKKISSTNIKHSIDLFKNEDINYMLSRPYSIKGKVVHGKKLGRKIGFKTANLEYNDFYLLPCGVYLVKVFIEGINNDFYGMCNVGYNPTVSNDKSIKIEVNIFDFDDDIYDTTIILYFIKLYRYERKFLNVDELKYQLLIDKKNLESYIKKI